VISAPLVSQLGRDAAFALHAVAGAARLPRAIESDVASSARTKPDASPVTLADFVVQAVIAARLARQYPDDVLVAEEDATALGVPNGDLTDRIVHMVRREEPGATRARVLAWIDRGRGSPGRRFWTLDPIDGTKGLLRGGQYAVALALIVDGSVQVGVLGCPRLPWPGRASAPPERSSRIHGGFAVAARGKGTWWTVAGDTPAVRLGVSSVADPASARVLHSVEASHSNTDRLHDVLAHLGVREPPLIMDSQAKHAVLAGGGADILLRVPTQLGSREAIWDQAAGSLIVEEAGGRVTDLTGRPLDFSTGRRLARNEGVVATNRLLHETVLAALRSCPSRLR